MEQTKEIPTSSQIASLGGMRDGERVTSYGVSRSSHAKVSENHLSVNKEEGVSIYPVPPSGSDVVLSPTNGGQGGGSGDNVQETIPR